MLVHAARQAEWPGDYRICSLNYVKDEKHLGQLDLPEVQLLPQLVQLARGRLVSGDLAQHLRGVLRPREAQRLLPNRPA